MHSRSGEKVILVKLPILITQSILGILLLVVSISSLAETTFTYQGRLSQSGELANGIYDMRFNLFDAVTAGSLIGPTVNQTGVKVLDGVFNVMLDFGDSPFGSDPRWLRIEVKEAGGGAFVALFPRQRVGASPFAIETLAVAPGAIDTAAIQDNAVTTTKIADGNVFTDDLANYAVSTIKLSNEAVTRTKVANDAIGTAQIENNTISSSDIRDGTISQTDVAGGFLLTSKSQVYLVEGDTLDVQPGGVVEPSATCADSNDMPLAYFCDVVTSLHSVTVRENFQLNWDSNSLPSEARCSMKNNAANLVAEVRVELACIAVP